jgi:hypothetical protein
MFEWTLTDATGENELIELKEYQNLSILNVFHEMVKAVCLNIF